MTIENTPKKYLEKKVGKKNPQRVSVNCRKISNKIIRASEGKGLAVEKIVEEIMTGEILNLWKLEVHSSKKFNKSQTQETLRKLHQGLL